MTEADRLLPISDDHELPDSSGEARPGTYVVVRIGSFGSPFRGEWVNVGVRCGTDDDAEWCSLVSRDWEDVARRTRHPVTDWMRSMVEQMLVVATWADVERKLDAGAHALGVVQYTVPRPCVIGRYPRVMAARLFQQFVSDPPAEIGGTG